jgi:hypothetical protein
MSKQRLITNYFIHNNLSIVIDPSDNKDFVIGIIGINNMNESCKGYNEESGNWHCIECGENMGDNPRQLCGKSYCRNA